MISCATVVALVALRVAIGWHFFQEGLEHKNNPNWSHEVEGFLSQAKGPFAPLYAEQLPAFHQFDRLLRTPLSSEDEALGPASESASVPESTSKTGGSNPKPEDSPIYGQWYATVVKDWDAQRAATANFYRFSDEQIQASQTLLDDEAKRLAKALAGHAADIAAYRQALEKNQELAAMPGAKQIPNLSARLAKRTANPTCEPGISVASGPADWRADTLALETDFHRALSELATGDQHKLGSPPVESTALTKINSGIIWLLMIAGGCLLIGLFTRLSAVVLALFLLSVIASQPPWISGTMPTYDQVVECIALVVLATSHVGRWAGLDFFIHHLFLRRRPANQAAVS